jgi:hypothetical protein
MVMVCLKRLRSWNLPEKSEENTERTLSQDSRYRSRDSNHASPKYESEAWALEPASSATFPCAFAISTAIKLIILTFTRCHFAVNITHGP